MSDAGYSTARQIARAVRTHFERYVAAADGQEKAVLPETSDVERLVDVAFWASLLREEGYLSKISLALVPPDRATLALRFARPLSLTPHALAKVAPAVERPGIHLGVWREGDALCVWGTTRGIPPVCLVVEVAAPGLLVAKHHRGEQEGAKFVNVAVIEGNDMKIVDENARNLPDCPALLSSLVGFHSPASWRDSMNVLVEIAVSMREHGRGGLLLVVPAESEEWRHSIVHPIAYGLDPPFCELAELIGNSSPEDRRERDWQDAVGRAVDAIAGLTAVDGATIITERYELLAFGAKIVRRDGAQQVGHVRVTEPIEGTAAATMHTTELGGTRHLSAAQFAQDQPDAVALVASQDGRFTLFAWSPCEGNVHAHRVETLLL